MNKISALGIECFNSCNLSGVCTHCYGVTGIANTSNTITLNQKVVDVVIREAPSIVESITITGGEPTVRPDFVKKIVSGIRLPWMLMTNDTIWSNNLRPSAVLISLDPPDLRPNIDPIHVMENALKYDCDISVNTVLSAGIEIRPMYELLKDISVRLAMGGHKISEWKLGFVIQKGHATRHPEIFADWDKIFLELRDFLKIYFREKPFHVALRGSFFTKNIGEKEKRSRINLSRNPCLDCFSRSKLMCINTDGCLQMCSVARNKSIPIKNSLIDAAIKALQLPELIKLTYDDWKQCLGCRWFSLCGGGCPSLAETSGQGWTGKDLYQCEIMKRTEEILLPVFPRHMQQIYKIK